ncbi:MAG: hypothetical protein Q4C30_08565, partial [Bacteroidia bacterium]|nr:hypothetical protein [Bacteroidia bacterium]
MGRTEEMKKYISNKHTGGKNNQKGNLYEDFYAIYQIAYLLKEYANNLTRVSFETQTDNFVDDLLIKQPNINIYYQLKNTRSITWGDTEHKGDIAFDFAQQIYECIERDEFFRLNLIHSANNSTIATSIPIKIKDYSDTIFFPYNEDINQLVHSNK